MPDWIDLQQHLFHAEVPAAGTARGSVKPHPTARRDFSVALAPDLLQVNLWGGRVTISPPRYLSTVNSVRMTSDTVVLLLSWSVMEVMFVAVSFGRSLREATGLMTVPASLTAQAVTV